MLSNSKDETQKNAPAPEKELKSEPQPGGGDASEIEPFQKVAQHGDAMDEWEAAPDPGSQAKP